MNSFIDAAYGTRMVTPHVVVIVLQIILDVLPNHWFHLWASNIIDLNQPLKYMFCRNCYRIDIDSPYS